LSKQLDNGVTHNHLIHQETKSIDTKNISEFENEFESILSDFEGEMDKNSIKRYDSWISLNDSDSCHTVQKSSSKHLIPPEEFGVGANKNVNLSKTLFSLQYLFCKNQMYRYILSQIN